MKATITVKTNGNRSTIIITRSMATKIMTVATSDLERITRNIVVNLSNAGYAVK